MRPPGIIRVALLEAAVRLHAEKGPVTWLEIANAAVVPVSAQNSVAGESVQRGIAADLAKRTVHKMVEAHQLEIVGSEKPAGSRHWFALIAPPQRLIDELQTEDPAARLGGMLNEVQAFG